MDYSEYKKIINTRHIIWCPNCDEEILGKDSFVDNGMYRCSSCGRIITFRYLLEILEATGKLNEVCNFKLI